MHSCEQRTYLSLILLNSVCATPINYSISCFFFFHLPAHLNHCKRSNYGVLELPLAQWARFYAVDLNSAMRRLVGKELIYCYSFNTSWVKNFSKSLCSKSSKAPKWALSIKSSDTQTDNDAICDRFNIKTYRLSVKFVNRIFTEWKNSKSWMFWGKLSIELNSKCEIGSENWTELIDWLEGESTSILLEFVHVVHSEV